MERRSTLSAIIASVVGLIFSRTTPSEQSECDMILCAIRRAWNMAESSKDKVSNVRIPGLKIHVALGELMSGEPRIIVKRRN